MLPERMIPLLLTRSSIDSDTVCSGVSKTAQTNLASILKKFMFRASGTRSLKEAFVTGGGVSLKEIQPKSMESKLTPGLFFCGEILDIHGYTPDIPDIWVISAYRSMPQVPSKPG